jgi:hypothetical protein
MVDLGLFNFIKNAVAQGKSKGEIDKALSGGGWDQASIDTAYTDVANNNSPVTSQTSASASSTVASRAFAIGGNRPTIITVLCGYYFVSFILSLINFIPAMVSLAKVPGVNYSSLLNIGLLFSLAIFVAMLGYWGMKKWGVYLYVVAEASVVAYLFVKIPSFSGAVLLSLIVGLILPVFVVYTGLKNFDRMS